ncbi:hypothetical protein [Longimicrobium sp.]|uniref:hypothetical protein n=1 Tax=Longimicrobium sp. TaxID=2029185 RepID=UPI002E31F4A0|nr:hypothetical protein [Longimicrobium sp.]HEX6040294.1 hypothetical protein [Longimicrobium sp.]
MAERLVAAPCPTCAGSGRAFLPGFSQTLSCPTCDGTCRTLVVPREAPGTDRAGAARAGIHPQQHGED